MQVLNKSVFLKAFLIISIVTAYSSSSPTSNDEEHKPKLVKINSENSDEAINFMSIRKTLQKSKAIRGALRLNEFLDEKDENLQADIRHGWSSSLGKPTGWKACQKVNYIMDFSKYQKKSGLQNEFTDSKSTKEARYGFHPPHKPPHLPPHKPEKWWGQGPSSWNEYENYEDYDDYWWYYEIEDHAVEGVRTVLIFWLNISQKLLRLKSIKNSLGEN